MEGRPYELVDDPKPPPLPGRAVVRQDDDLRDLILAELFTHALSCARAFGSFHMALSGGSTPEPLYKQLMYDPALRDFPWRRTHLWMVDERRVPMDDPRSNFAMIRQTIVEHSDIPAEQVHPILTDHLQPHEHYQSELRRVLEWRERGHDRLDYVLLGVGEDGHVASLFPRSRGLESRDLVCENEGPTVTPPPRISMTLPLINASRFVAVYVSGGRKRAIVERLSRAWREWSGRSGSGGLPRHVIEELPALGLAPMAGELRWYVDTAAAGVGGVPEAGASGTTGPGHSSGAIERPF